MKPAIAYFTISGRTVEFQKRIVYTQKIAKDVEAIVVADIITNTSWESLAFLRGTSMSARGNTRN